MKKHIYTKIFKYFYLFKQHFDKFSNDNIITINYFNYFKLSIIIFKNHLYFVHDQVYNQLNHNYWIKMMYLDLRFQKLHQALEMVLEFIISNVPLHLLIIKYDFIDN